MTLDESIKYIEEVAEEQEILANKFKSFKDYGNPKSSITSGYEKCKNFADEHKQLAEWLKELKQLREQELKIKVLDDMEAAKRLGTVDVYMASAWLKFIKDLKILGLRVCEVTESEGEE